jgi:CubicO group peptidase (beta-lactamase class C family)
VGKKSNGKYQIKCLLGRAGLIRCFLAIISSAEKKRTQTEPLVRRRFERKIMNAYRLTWSAVILLTMSLVAPYPLQGQVVYYGNSATYIGNSLAVTNGTVDGAPPFVILGEYNPAGPSATTSIPLTVGTVQDVQFYGQNYNFTLYALSLVSSGLHPNEQIFQVVASQNFSGTASSPGLQTLTVSSFTLTQGEFLAFAGVGPWYPQNPNDAPGSDATYENSSGVGSFTATPPGGPGSQFVVGLHADSAANYDYISDEFNNQGRSYAIGVDISWSVNLGTVDFGYVPVGTTLPSYGSWNGGSWNGTNLIMTVASLIGPNTADFSVSPNYTGDTLYYGQNYPYTLSFDPLAAGYASVVMTNNEIPNPPFGPSIVNVHGIGLPSARPATGPIVPELAPLQVAMTNYLVTHQFEAGTLALMYDTKLVFREGYGWRDTNFTTVIHPDNLFRLASVSKMLTSSAIAKLVDEGYITTNTLVYNYLGIPPWGGVLGDSRILNITVQMLLDHSGGWNNFTSPVGEPPFDTIEISSDLNLDYPAAATNVISWMFSKPLDFTPGTTNVYCNFGYQILGRVIEKASGKPYLDYIQQNLLGDAGISNSLGFLNVVQSHSRPSDLAPWEIWYADLPSLDPLGPSAVDYPTPLTAQWAYGGGYYESFDSFGGLSASAIGLCNYLMNYWESGDQRIQGEYYDWGYIFYGSLPGATSVLYQDITQTPTSTNGLEFAALFNERDSGTNDNEEAETAIVNATGSISSWPTNGGGAIQWDTPSAAVANTSGQITIDLVRSGLSTLPVKVSYTTYSLTATSSDYVPASGIVSFAANQTSQPVTVTVLNNGPSVPPRQFSLELISASGGAWLGSQLSSVVTIIPPLPELTIERVGADSVVVSWADTGNYVLQYNNNVSSSNWAAYNGTVTTANGSNNVTITPPTGNQYFRLAFQ